MMKYVFKLLFMIVFIISGCSQAPEQTKKNEISEKEQTVQQEDVNENQQSVGDEKSNKTDQQHSGAKEKPTVEEDDPNKATDQTREVVNKPQYRINPKTFSVEPIADANERVVLLTIDDAPDKYALEMANTLKSLGVKAIFFVNGHFIDSAEEKNVLKKIHELGFPIGNHTWNHKKLPDLSKEEQRKEIVRLNDEIEKLTGERPKFFRAPHGLNSDYSSKVVEEEKMVLMNWSYGYDYMQDYMTKEALADIMVNTNLLHSGSNLLMHDRKWTNAALADIVTGLQEKGYKMVDPALIETP